MDLGIGKRSAIGRRVRRAAVVVCETLENRQLLSIPVAPTGLRAVASGSSGISVNWTDNSANETGFVLDRATDSAFSLNLISASLAANTISYNVTALSADTRYYFRVRAYNADGASSNSTAVNTATMTTAGTFTLDPDSNIAGGTWASFLYTNLKKSARQPTDPNTQSCAQVIMAAKNVTSEVGLSTVTLQAGTTISSVTLWAYTGSDWSAGDIVNWNLRIGGNLRTAQAQKIGATNSWSSFAWKGLSLSQSDLDGMQVWANAVHSSGQITYVYQVYCEVSPSGGTNAAPTVATAAAASPATVMASSTNLSVLGADDGGESALRYTWSVTSKPSGAADPTFSVNGANGAKNTTATFGTAGSYTLTATITDAGGATVASSVNVSVVQTLSSILVSPSSVTMAAGGSSQFAASAKDQFGNSMAPQPAITWSVDSGGVGTVNSSGLYTTVAGNPGAATVRASSGSISGKATVTVTSMVIPVAPSGLTAYSGQRYGMTLNWTDNSKNENGFVIEMATDPTFTFNFAVVNVPANTVSYVAYSLIGNAPYCFRVRASSAAGFSGYSNTVTASPLAASGVPAVPGSPSATSNSPTQVSLNWVDLSGMYNPEDGFLIERAMDSGFTTGLARITVGEDVVSFVDSTCAAGTSYYYRIRSFNDAGWSNPSAVVSVAGTETPAAPSALTASATSSSTVSLSWVDNATNETAYSVERKTGSAGTYAVIATLAANSTGYSDSALIASTQYFYRVRAANGTGMSAYCTEASVTTLAITGGSVVLTPGSGFTGATATPARMGTSSQFGYNDKVIAHWDTVPFQTIAGQLNVGIVAFHNSGISRVDFSVSGGAWTSVKQMTLNPTTGVVEYWCTLDASKFSSDGPVELRAIAYPNVGIPRVFQGTTNADNGEQSLFLDVNAYGTLTSKAVYVSAASGSDSNTGTQASPFKTIGAAGSALGANGDGAVIYLMAGDYVYGEGTSSPTTFSRWLTITTAPGVAKSAARIVGCFSDDGLGTKLVHFQNLTFAPPTAEAQYILANLVADASVWVDNCNLVGPGRTVDGAWISDGFAASYVTDTTISACRDGIPADLVRNVTISGIGSDAFSGAHMVINSSASGTDSSGTTFHADVFQLYGGGELLENYILYGVTARVGTDEGGQGVFVGRDSPTTDIAIVNCSISNQYGGDNTAVAFSFESPTTNLYVKSSTFDGNAFWRDDLTFVATDVVLEGSTFTWGLYSTQTPEPGVLIR